jgi:2,3-bisphosphoglycerate-dependent phosphoglycerate mutase
MARDFQQPFRLPEGATEIVLVRHGSAVKHSASDVDGHRDPPLSESGVAQAEAVGARLAAEPVAALFVTPLRRTAETAAPLAGHLGLTPQVVGELREVHLGDREHGFDAQALGPDPVAAKLFAAGRWDVIPNAEDMDAFGDRVTRGMAHLVEATGPGGTGVVVTHAGVIAEACRQVTQSHAFAFLYAENGSLTRLLRLAGGRWALRSFNDTAHLGRSAPSAAPGSPRHAPA